MTPPIQFFAHGDPKGQPRPLAFVAIPRAPKYEISEFGDIRRIGSGSLLKPWAHKSGHLYVSLGRGNKFQVHHLVLETFGPKRDHGLECRHLDGDPRNNHISNLCWGTRKENVDDYRKLHGRYMRKDCISDSLAKEIRSRLTGRKGEKSTLATEYGVSRTVVSFIANGRTFRGR